MGSDTRRGRGARAGETSMAGDDIHRQAFREEADELLMELEASLLELEAQPGNAELINKVFRAMHTLKGSGAMFGFDDIAVFTHDVESVFDRVRNGEITITKRLLDLTLGSCDHIKWLLETPDAANEAENKGPELLAGFRSFLPGQEPQGAPGGTDDAAAPQQELEKVESIYRIRFRPDPMIFSSGSNPALFIEDLGEIGACKAFLYMDKVPPLDEIDPFLCYVWWDVLLRSSERVEEIQDIFAFVEDQCELVIEPIAREDEACESLISKKLGEILVERGDIDPEILNSALSSQKRLGDILTSAGIVSEHQVESALAEQQAAKEFKDRRAPQTPAAASSSIRISAEKLDLLVDLVGELVIVQAQIKQAVAKSGDVFLNSLSEQLERLSDDLRDSTLGIRMLPIGATFNKFRRLVRDLSAELGKEIELVTSGEETELDKTVIERLGDPLVHLLRNSIDHGIESPDERQAKGKPRAGVVSLSAEHSGGEGIIRIADDGAGMDPGRIRAKAVERGLIAPDAELSDKDVYSLIFLPGFSTAEKVTSVSGRGVGMDVVKRAIDQLRGGVEIDSQRDKGSVISIRLPLTLVIINGLQIRIGEEHYVIPLSIVEECVGLSRHGGPADQSQIINLRGESVPFIRLREWFEIEGTPPSIEQIVITSVDGMRVGLVVDNVIGEHQTVIKSLGRIYRDVEGLSGATIKGDGSMALILDVPGLLRAINEQPATYREN